MCQAPDSVTAANISCMLTACQVHTCIHSFDPYNNPVSQTVFMSLSRRTVHLKELSNLEEEEQRSRSSILSDGRKVPNRRSVLRKMRPLQKTRLNSHASFRYQCQCRINEYHNQFNDYQNSRLYSIISLTIPTY